MIKVILTEPVQYSNNVVEIKADSVCTEDGWVTFYATATWEDVVARFAQDRVVGYVWMDKE